MNFPPFKMILVLTNFSLLSFLIMLMVDHYNSHYNVESWSSAFHVLTLLWLSIRGAFWLCTAISTTPWNSMSFYVLYWMANPIEFGSFMLLPLFFSQVLYPTEWKKYWRCIRVIYIGVITSLIIFQALWAFLVALEMKDMDYCDSSDPEVSIGQPAQCFHTEFSSNAFRAITASCFVFLAIVQACYGFKLLFLEKKLHERYLISSPSMLAGVNAILVVSFLSRGLYQFGAVFSYFLLPDIPLQGNDDVSFTILFAFIIWDYFPTMLLVVTITSKALGTNTNRVKSKLSGATWHTHKETSSINASRITFPGYGLFRQFEDEECSSVASSYPSQASSAEMRGGTLSKEMCFINESADQDPNIMTLTRFELPSSLTPPTSWLNTSFLEATGRRTSFRSTSSSGYQQKEHGSGDALQGSSYSPGPNHGVFPYGPYRSYSQGSDERELAILLYYDNDRRRRTASVGTGPPVKVRQPSRGSGNGSAGGSKNDSGGSIEGGGGSGGGGGGGGGRQDGGREGGMRESDQREERGGKGFYRALSMDEEMEEKTHDRNDRNKGVQSNITNNIESDNINTNNIANIINNNNIKNNVTNNISNMRVDTTTHTNTNNNSSNINVTLKSNSNDLHAQNKPHAPPAPKQSFREEKALVAGSSFRISSQIDSRGTLDPDSSVHLSSRSSSRTDTRTDSRNDSRNDSRTDSRDGSRNDSRTDSRNDRGNNRENREGNNTRDNVDRDGNRNNGNNSNNSNNSNSNSYTGSVGSTGRHPNMANMSMAETKGKTGGHTDGTGPEQKVCVTSANVSPAAASESLVALYETYKTEQRHNQQQQQQQQWQKEQVQQAHLQALREQQQHELDEEHTRNIYSRRRTSANDVINPSHPSARSLVRSSSASRAQGRPLQRREGSHALPIVNSPSPPDPGGVSESNWSAGQQPVYPTQQGQQQGQAGQQGGGGGQTGQIGHTGQLQQPVPQAPSSSSRRGSNTLTPNIYSPSVNYPPSPSNSHPNNPNKKGEEGKKCIFGRPRSRDNGLAVIPQWRPRSAGPITGKNIDQMPSQPLQPLHHNRHQQQQQQQLSPQTKISPPVMNIFLNTFKSFNPFGGNFPVPAPKSRIPQTTTNSPKAPKSPKIELIHSRPTRPPTGLFFSPASSFGLSSIGGNFYGHSKSIDGLNSAAEGMLIATQDPYRIPSGAGISAPRSEDDLMFLNRASIARPQAVPNNARSPTTRDSRDTQRGNDREINREQRENKRDPQRDPQREGSRENNGDDNRDTQREQREQRDGSRASRNSNKQ